MKPAVGFKELGLIFLLGVIHAVRGATEGAAAMTTCKTSPVEEGGNGFMEFSFSHEINFTNANVLFYLRKNQRDANLLTCDCMDKCPQPFIPCTSDNSHFTTKGLIGHTLTVLIPNATRELQGVYVLSGFLNGPSYPATNCSFTVLEKRALTAEKHPEINTIVVPVVAVAVLVVILAAIIGFLFVRRRRSRNREGPITSTTETEVMHTAEDSARSVEEADTV